jgi:hypothetical protein
MGLDFHVEGGSVECPRWAYSGFHRFRTRLAEAIRIHYDSMDGLGGRRSWAGVHDALVPLLTHSDCDGELSPAECARVAPRLREVVRLWPEGDSDRERGLRLADAMDEAVRLGVALEFC